MDATALQEALDEIFDDSLIHHGYTDYMRDYEAIVYQPADPRSGLAPVQLRYLFRHCVEAHCRTAVPPETWRRSLDDRLTDYETGVDLDGFVWGVKWQCLYPGAKIVPRSKTAATWSKALGLDFHEIQIQTEAHNLTLVFADLRVTRTPAEH